MHAATPPAKRGILGTRKALPSRRDEVSESPYSPAWRHTTRRGSREVPRPGTSPDTGNDSTRKTGDIGDSQSSSLPEGRGIRVPILPRLAPHHPAGIAGSSGAWHFPRCTQQLHPQNGGILGTRKALPSRRDEVSESPFFILHSAFCILHSTFFTQRAGRRRTARRGSRRAGASAETANPQRKSR